VNCLLIMECKTVISPVPQYRLRGVKMRGSILYCCGYWHFEHATGEVELHLYRPEKAFLSLPEVEAPRTSRQSAHEGGKVVSLTHRPSLAQEISVVLISVRG